MTLVKFDNGREDMTEKVPYSHPYGSITDGDYVCSRCREPITGCALCAGEVRSVVRIKGGW